MGTKFEVTKDGKVKIPVELVIPTTAPATAETGHIYYNSGERKIYTYDGERFHGVNNDFPILFDVYSHPLQYDYHNRTDPNAYPKWFRYAFSTDEIQFRTRTMPTGVAFQFGFISSRKYAPFKTFEIDFYGDEPTGHEAFMFGFRDLIGNGIWFGQDCGHYFTLWLQKNGSSTFYQGLSFTWGQYNTCRLEWTQTYVKLIVNGNTLVNHTDTAYIPTVPCFLWVNIQNFEGAVDDKLYKIKNFRWI